MTANYAEAKRPRHLWRGLRVCVIIGALLAGGCGAGSSSDGRITVKSGSLAKAQFVKRADAICKKTRKRLDARFGTYLQHIGGQAGVSQSRQVILARRLMETIYIPEYEKQIETIATLGAPKGDEEEVATILEAMSQALIEAGEHPLKFVRGADPDFRPFAEAVKLARAYGLISCSRV